MKTPSAFIDKEYRDAFVWANIKNGVAFQLRALREKRGLKQKELAGEIGKRQSSISRLEDPSYGKFNIKTLQEFASFYDVGLIVRFVPFSELLWLVQDNSPTALAAVNFSDEYRCYEEYAENIRTKFPQPEPPSFDQDKRASLQDRAQHIEFGNVSDELARSAQQSQVAAQ